MSVPEKIWRQATLPLSSTIQEAITRLDKTGIRIVLVVNDKGELEGTVSDGDIRRGLLRGLSLSNSNQEVLHKNPLVVPPNMSRELIKQLMTANKIQQIPILDHQRKIIGIHLWDEIAETELRANTMVIMAGGIGTRLRPHTETCPKPLLPVAGKPMLEHIIERAKSQGIERFTLSLNYLGHMIQDYFGDGSKWQVEIKYLQEDSPLGTAGALSLVEPDDSLPFIVTNGDVLTDINYAELLDFHTSHLAMATMAVRTYEWQNPFGVVETNGINIVGIHEKPVSQSHVNAGIYVLEPLALDLLESGAHTDMPTLFERIMAGGSLAVAYPMHEPWLDVGRPEDLERAHREHEGTTPSVDD
ncbi:MAG: nucleotidyltransferase family protein [Halioglobus sp.]